METIRVNMTPCEDIKTIHASQNDNEAREWGFELHNNGEKIDSSSISDQLVFKAYKGGTEQILPTNGSTPTTSPFLGDIKYPQGLLSDQEFLYRESPTEEDGLAKITDIKGNTLVWNQQLLAPTTSASATASADGSFRANRCTFTYDSATHIITITSLENMGTSGFVFGLTNGAPLIVGHKYLQMCDVQAPKVFNFVIGVNGSTDIKSSLSANTYHRVSTIKEFGSSSNEFLFNFHSNNAWTGTETVYIKNAMLFDLTQMGLDISSPSDFTSLFSLPYYDYNQGTLLSFNGNGIKTVGKNLLEIVNTTRTVNGITYTLNDDGSIRTQGTATGTTYFVFTNSNNSLSEQNTTPFKKGMTIICTTGTAKSLNCRKVNGDYMSLPSSTAIVLPEDLACVYLQYGQGETIDITIYPMIRLANVTDSTFEPYTSSTLSLPISTYFSNGMKSAGSVYDELTPSKAITRIGSVDLGSLTWQYLGNNAFLTTVSELKPPTSNGDIINAKSNKYSVVTYNALTSDASLVCLSGYVGTNRIYVRDTSYTDATAFKQAMTDQNVKLYYELATPTETSFTTASLVTENGEIPLSNEDGVLVGKCTEQLSSESGFIDAKIKLADEDGECYSNKIQLHIERSPQ